MSPQPGKHDGILAVWNNCTPGCESEYEDWYQTEHLPERVGIPGFIRGRRYQALDATHQFFTYYEVDSPSVLTSDEYRQHLNAPTERTQHIMSGVFIDMTRSICRCLHRVGQFRGAYALTAHGLSGDIALEIIGVQTELAASISLARAEFWQAETDMAQPSAEEKIRGQDSRIDTCLFVEVLRAADLAAWHQAVENANATNVSTYSLLNELESQR